MINKIFITIVIAIQILKLINFNHPAEYYFDENYAARAAVALANHNQLEIWQPPLNPPIEKRYEWVHPPFNRLLITASIETLGNQPWVWRIPSLIAGYLTVGLIFLIANKLFNYQTALWSVTLWSLDPLNFAFSRIATGEILITCLSLIFIYLLLTKKYLFSLIILGLAVSTKWTALSLYLILVYFLYIYQKLAIKKITLVLLSSFLFVISIYTTCYLPYFVLGQNSSDFIQLQQNMFQHTTTLTHNHFFSSQWYSWPIGWKPMALFTNKTGQQIWAIPNVYIFWSGIISLVYHIYKIIQKRKTKNYKKINLLIASFVSLWIPWSIITLINPLRPTFIYYYLPSLAILTIILSYSINKIIETHPKNQKIYTLGFLIINTIYFLILSPKILAI